MDALRVYDIGTQYGVEKLGDAVGTDKTVHRYLLHYEVRFESRRNEEIALLEIGVMRGASLRMWRDYFPRGAIDGIDVGYEALDETTDVLNVIPGAVAAIKANLALYLAPEYSRVVSAALAARAKSSKRALRASIQLRRTQYPDTLPIGSGNEDNNFVADGDQAGLLRSSKFYPSNDEGQCN